MWLSSVSIARDGVTVCAGKMREEERRLVEETLSYVTRNIGDDSRRRLFRMNLTTCLHKGLTEQEEAGLPAWFNTAEPIDIAGGPVEVLWENVKGKLSTRPCKAPTKQLISPERPDLWFPVDCGLCEPCKARAEYPNYTPKF